MNWPKFPRISWSAVIGKPGWASSFDGSYTSLSGKPTIPAAQVNSDWNAVSGVAQILNKPTIPAAAPVIQRTRAQTNTSGVLVWNFPVSFSGNPILAVTVEDNSSATWNHQITALSSTSATIQITKTTSVTVLGISVLGIAANPQAFVHVIAVAP